MISWGQPRASCPGPPIPRPAPNPSVSARIQLLISATSSSFSSRESERRICPSRAGCVSHTISAVSPEASICSTDARLTPSSPNTFAIAASTPGRSVTCSRR